MAATVIDCQGSATQPRRAFFIHGNEGPDTRIAGLTIRNGYTSGGGAVRCERLSGPTIQDCVFQTNTSTWNGGAFINAGTGYPQMVRCRFENNTAVHGGAITSESDSRILISECTFQSNTVTGNGGAIDCYEATATLTNCSFTGNHADDNGGALWVNGGSYVTMEDCTFTTNSATYEGGAVAVTDSSTAYILGGTFTGNQGENGGAVQPIRARDALPSRRRVRVEHRIGRWWSLELHRPLDDRAHYIHQQPRER